MAQTRNRKIRELRGRGKDRLVKVANQLNALTWDLAERNAPLGDANVAESVLILDDALNSIQRATMLMNSVIVMGEATDVAAEKVANPVAAMPANLEPVVAVPTKPSLTAPAASAPAASAPATSAPKTSAPKTSAPKTRAVSPDAPPVATLKT